MVCRIDQAAEQQKVDSGVTTYIHSLFSQYCLYDLGSIVCVTLAMVKVAGLLVSSSTRLVPTFLWSEKGGGRGSRAWPLCLSPTLILGMALSLQVPSGWRVKGGACGLCALPPGGRRGMAGRHLSSHFPCSKEHGQGLTVVPRVWIHLLGPTSFICQVGR